MLNRLAREFAAEISSHDWSDAPYRLDRAGHQRRFDRARSSSDQQPLSEQETAYVRTNVMWVTAQVLRNADPNLDLYEYAAACGVPWSIIHRTNGSHSGAIKYGLRWEDGECTEVSVPGAPPWRVVVAVEVPNLVVLRRLLERADGYDTQYPPQIEDIDSMGGALRHVTLVVRDFDQHIAAQRAADIVDRVCQSLVVDGPASVVSVTEA